MAMEIRKAARQKSRLRLQYGGPSGSGKTVGALLTAFGMTDDWGKIALIDTENRSADLYANHKLQTGVEIGEFLVLPLDAPYSPERYREAIKTCESAGVEVIVIDSTTHEWTGKGGCLEIQEKLGGKYQNWAEVTPRHKSFIDAILQSPCHIIQTARAKVDYAMTNENGKVKVEKVGLKDDQREGMDFEMTVDFDLDLLHNARVSKDRTGLFDGKPAFIPSIETGKMLKAWCEAGAAPAPAPGATPPTAPNPEGYTVDGIKAEIDAAESEDVLEEIITKIKGIFQGADRKAIAAAWNAKKTELGLG